MTWADNSSVFRVAFLSYLLIAGGRKVVKAKSALDPESCIPLCISSFSYQIYGGYVNFLKTLMAFPYLSCLPEILKTEHVT